MPIDWVTVQAAMHAWVVGATGLSAQSVVWGGQDAPRPAGVAITMLIPNISMIGIPWMDTEANPLVFADKAITAVDATANTLTCVAHGLLTGDGPARFASTVALPGGLVAATDYWIIKVDVNTIKVASTFFNAMTGAPSAPAPIAIDLTSVGSGTITVADTADTLRAGEEIKATSVCMLRVTLELRAHSATVDGAIATGPNMAMAVLERVRARSMLPSQRDILNTANLGLGSLERIRGIQGIRDALLFEPRAYMDIHISMVSEESEAITIIQRVLVTDLATAIVTTITDPDAVG